MSVTARRQGYLCLKIRVEKRRRTRWLPAALVALCSCGGSIAAEAADLVGATAGELGVSPSGSASYSIPIAVPPGTTGLEPKITLQYDSLAGNGAAGMGWSVGGLATITRCPTSLNIDGTGAGAPGVHPVSYDSLDKFCLNGERLVPVVGIYGAANTEYRTHQEEFSRIISYGTQGSGPQYFKVWRKSGEILEFGVTADSRVKALGRTDNSVWLWALDKLSDTYGNYETFSYTDDTVSGGYRISRIDYTGNAGQSLAPYNHIDFVYATRPDVAKIYEAGSKATADQRLTNIKAYADATLFRDYQITYETTPGLSGRSRPTSVKECATNPTGGTDCLPATVFQWSPDGQAAFTNHYQPVHGLSGGVDFTYFNVIGTGDFNGDGRTDLYLARTSSEGWKVVEAGRPDHVWLSDGNGGFLPDIALPASLPEGYVASFGDFNGDGLTDVYAYRVDGTMRALYNAGYPDLIYLSNGDGTFGPPVSLGLLAPAHYHVLAAGDFNADGLTDLLLAWTYDSSALNLMYGGGSGPVVLLGNPAGQLTAVPAAGINISSYNYFAIPTSGDFNSDGLTDLYVFRSDKKLRKYDSSVPDHIWRAVWTPSGSSGTLSFQDVQIPAAQSFSNEFGIAAAGDFNGDGLTDFYVNHMEDSDARSNGNGNDQVWLSTGDLTPSGQRFLQINNSDYPGCSGLGGPTCAQLPKDSRVTATGDFNGDGLTDLYVMHTQDGQPLANQDENDFILGSRGDGTFQKITLTGSGMTSTLGGYEIKAVGDFYGDGLTGLYTFKADSDGSGRSNGNTNDYIFQSAWKFPDQLAGITNGLGLSTQLNYKPLTDTTVYTKGTGSLYPVEEVIAPRYVVSEVKADDGIGGQNSQTYAYQGLRTHLYDIGNLGFAKMTVTDQAKGIVTESTYSQDWASNLHGLLTESKVTAPGGVVLQDQNNTWLSATGATSDGTPRIFRYLSSSATTKHDLNGATLPSATETTEYDGGTGDPFSNYGFPTRVVVQTVDNSVTYTKTTDNAYDHFTSTWILGRLRTAAVKHQQSNSADMVRSSAFTYVTNKGALLTETVEPGSTGSTGLFYKKKYDRNGFGAIYQMTETWGNKNNTTITTPDGSATVTSRVTSYDYDHPRYRYKTHESNALAHNQDNSYDTVTGVLTSTTGPNGLTTSWGQDAFGRPLRETRADGTYTTTDRYLCGGGVPCPANAVIKIVTNVYGSDGAVIAPTATAYQDKLYRDVRKSTLSLNGSEVDADTIYDGQGRIAQKSEPFFNGASTIYWTQIQYDKLDRPVLTTRPDSSTQSVDYNGLIETSTNELGQHKIVKKDALGRMARVTDDAGTAVLYAYDAIGQLTQTQIEGVAASVSTYAYDIRGNKVADNDPDKGSWTYDYNALGLVTKQTDAKGQVTKMTYDVLGRMLTRTDVAISTTSSWGYDKQQDGSDAKGKLTSVSMPGYAKQIYYDHLQREDQVDETIEGAAYTTTTAYEQSGSQVLSSRVSSVSYPSGYTITNNYDAYGHLASVTDPTGAYLWRALTDDARGNITEFKLGTQVDSIRAYDPQRGWLKSIVSTKVSSGASLQDLKYVFNAVGNLSHRGDHELGTTPLTEDSIYDDLNRLTSSTVIQSGAVISAVTVGYDLTGFGNIASKSDIGTYTYGQGGLTGCGSWTPGLHAVTTIAGSKNTTYCYDKNGNMLSGDGRTIAYAPYDLPQTITRGFSTVTFSYGPERQRYKRVDSTSAGVTTTIYAADRDYEKITRPGGTIEQKFYIGDFAVVTRTGSGPYTDTTRFLLGDHLGSVDTIANANGTLAQKMSFDAWGKRREASWLVMGDPSQFDSTITTRGFTGHEELDPVGLVHMNGRVYDPEIGRFLSADPFVQDLSNTQAFNRYSYVLNNPLSLTDPTGFFFGSIFNAIGNFIGKLFSAVTSLLKAALKIPLIRAVIQIAACGSGVLAVCVGVSGALALVAGGSIEDAIKAMAFTIGSYGVWSGVGGFISDPLAIAMGVKQGVMDAATFGFAVVKGAIHGVVGGALSLAQGGDFMDGFVANAAGAFAGVMSEGVFGPAGTGGAQGYIGRVASAGIAAGTASELTGGKFANGAVTGAFAQMWNGEGIGHNEGPPLDDDEFSYTYGYPFHSYGNIKIYDVCPMCRVGPGLGLGALLAGAIGIGEYAGESIPARSPARDFTPEERAEINRIGSTTGCHTCGTSQPGTKSGNFIPDHQLPSALNPGGGPQRLYPQCLSCSKQQGLYIARWLQQRGR